MRIQANYWIDIHVLPDGARCKRTGKNPLDMDACPLCNFDDFGVLCVPEICDEYEEGEWPITDYRTKEGSI